jgi:hypothetical protein
MDRKPASGLSRAPLNLWHARRVFCATFILVVATLWAFSGSGHAQSDGATSPRDVRAETVPASASSITVFHKDIQPILRQYCYDCHGSGSKSGNLALDELKDDQLIDPVLWLKVLKNLRAGIMPPKGEERPSVAQQHQIETWIKTSAFASDPTNPDPGRVTLRRLNRTEYHNSVRDLLGVDFDVGQALPPDDVGYGFDNIGDVLSISPTRLEKFLEAAIAVVEQGVPKDTVAISSQTYYFRDFVSPDGRDADHMSFYQVRTVGKTINARAAGDYRIHIYCKIDGEPAPRDPQECRIHVTSDGDEFFTQQYHWADNDWFEDDSVVHWEAGDHVVAFKTEPVHPELRPLPTKMEYRIVSVRFDGPLDRSQWVHPPGFDKLYTRESPPTDPQERRAYAREVLNRFASKAFRHPVPETTLEHLVALAEKSYSLPETTFEKGIAQAIVAILASPRFLFHLEGAQPLKAGEAFPQIDEYSLAARLSFALWCSIPDDELTRLAAAGQLRKNFASQVNRMLADPKSQAFVESFSEQWLQTRAILDIPINSADVMAQDGTGGAPPAVAAVPNVAAPNAALGGAPVAAAAGGTAGAAPGFARGFRRGGRGAAVYTGTELTPDVRNAMKQEVDAYFGYVMRDDRSVLELLKSNYTFVNAALAPVYGLTNVSGLEMRKVELAENDPRGGVLTMGSVLTVTSNPTRTSPVKRGKWILENMLGAPTAPPPPNIPALEDSISKAKAGDHPPTQREVLAVHREDPLCASCHARMDPLGLALENFNAFGRFRSTERQQPIDPAGELVTGETFAGVADLKDALVKKHKMEFYRTLTGKLLTYVLGRGMEYYDVIAIDEIADRMDKEGGRFSSLLLGVLESAPVQRTRLSHGVAEPLSLSPPKAIDNE